MEAALEGFIPKQDRTKTQESQQDVAKPAEQAVPKTGFLKTLMQKTGIWIEKKLDAPISNELKRKWAAEDEVERYKTQLTLRKIAHQEQRAKAPRIKPASHPSATQK